MTAPMNNLMLFLSLITAIAPPIFILRYLVRKYRQNTDPKKMPVGLFVSGIVITVPVISLEYLLSQFLLSLHLTNFIDYLLRSFISTAAVEEFFKLIVVIFFAYPRKNFKHHIDGIVCTIAVSLGFACMENLLYLLKGGLGMAIVRTFTALPLHSIAAGIMGYYIGKARFAGLKKKESVTIYKGLYYAILIHGIYNFLLSANPQLLVYASIGVWLLLVLIFLILANKIKLAIGRDMQIQELKA